jgi:hypothetical protein
MRTANVGGDFPIRFVKPLHQHERVIMSVWVSLLYRIITCWSNDQRTLKAFSVLAADMGVVPIGAGLRKCHSVGGLSARGDAAAGYADGSYVSIISGDKSDKNDRKLPSTHALFWWCKPCQ